MKYFFFLLLIGNSMNGLPQPKIIFKDDFKNNKHHWKLYNDSDFVVKINKGKLYIEKKEINRIRNGCLWYSKKIPAFNTLKDFSITFYARVLAYEDVSPLVDIQWGKLSDCDNCNKTDSLYQIHFFPDKIQLALFNSRWTYYGRLITNIEIILHEFNKYEIIQKGDSLMVKINDVKILKDNINRISGGRIGIQQCLKNSWEIDKIIIRQ